MPQFGTSPVHDPVLVKPTLKRAGSTRYVIPGWQGTTLVGQQPDGQSIYYTPIWVAEETTYDRMGVHVSTLAAQLSPTRIALYTWNDNKPDALIVNADGIDPSTTGWKEKTISEVLARGHYFLAFWENSFAFYRGLNPIRTWGPLTGYATVGGSALDRTLLVFTNPDQDDYGTDGLPDPAPAPDSETTSAFMFVRLREAS